MEDDPPFDETSQPMDIDEPALVINPENKCFCDAPHCRELDLSNRLDALLDPNVIFTSNKQLERLWTLLAHGHGKREAYIAILNEYRNESHCGLAWHPDYVAYRCRTCSVALTMAICAECFRNGNHEGHDYNMFKSRSGGACDCGFSIMKSSGHCSNHGKNARAPRSNEPIPDSLICIPQRAMPRILGRLLTSLRRQSIDVVHTNETEIYLDTLTEIANSSAILKNIMIQALLSEEAYSSQSRIMGNHRDKLFAKEASDSLKILKQERKKLLAFKIPQRWSKLTISAFCDKKSHKTFLEEMIFWMVVYEFHQKLVCFLLSFLMDDDYKTIFAKLFVNYYPNIAVCLARWASQNRHQHTHEHLSRRILQVSVQIYNDSELTRAVCEEDLTLHTIIYCIRIMIEGSQADDIAGLLQPNALCQHQGAHGPKVLSCDNPLLRDRQMASFTEDLLSMLNFEHEAKRLLGDKDLLDVWLGMTSYFQTMSPYKRELYEHAPYETGPRLSMFMIESEFCLVPTWTILNHLRDEQSVAYTCQLLTSIHTTLATWLHAMSIGPHSKLDAYHMSFHIPLHRMLAATIRHMIYEQHVPEEQVYKLLCENQQVLGSKFSYRSAHGARVTIKIDDFLRMLLLHPLQALTLYHQTRSGMWTRNGLLTVNQAVTYVHCHFCYSIIDMDMFLLRYCGSRLKPDVFIKSFLQRFYAWHCLSFTCGPIFSDTPSDTLRTHYYFNIQPEQITQLVESCLVTLIELLTLENHCNISEREQTKRELITMISVADRPYSYIADMLPTITEQPRDDEVFDTLLKEVTDYKPPTHGASGNLQQGCYTLKSRVWEEEYNPIHVLYRYYQRRDYQQSIERFFQHAKLKGKLNRRHHSSALWPPLKVPDAKIANFGPIDLSPLIGCQTLLGVVFSIIYKCIYVEEMPDSMMAYTIHLLELSIRKYPDEKETKIGADNEAGASQAEPARNTNFAGRYCYRELISYYENMPKGESMLKGRTIYSLFTDDQPKTELEPMHKNIKFFPFVKHALDLAFDTTWFPFESVLDNCLVHIETVHSLPRDEFDVMVHCAAGEKNDNVESANTYEESLYTATAAGASANSEWASEQRQQQPPDMSASSSTRSTESQTGDWSNLIGIAMEEVDDIIIDDDDVDFIEDDDEEATGIVPSNAGSSESTSSDEDDHPFDPVATARELYDLTRTPGESSSSTVPDDQVTRTPSPQAPAMSERPSSRAGDANVEWASQGSSFRVGAIANNETAGVLSHTTAARSSTTVTAHNDNMPSAHRDARAVQAWADCVASAERSMAAQRALELREQRVSTLDERNLGDASQEQAQPLQAQNLITERRAILDSEPRPMITNPPHPLALEAATSASATASSRPSSVGSSANASTDTTNQELGQRGSSAAVAHSGADVPLVSGGSGGGPSSFTRSGAIVPRSFGELTGVSEHVGLRGTGTEAQRSQPQEFPNQSERSLSEVDIQARFMGFFQTDAVSRTNSSRIYRIRQTARRGNYRGAYLTEPYHAHINQNTQHNTTTVTNSNNFGGTGTPLASTNNNNTTNTNNNNNPEDGVVHELVRRSVAVVPAITNAVRATARATMSLTVAARDEDSRRRASLNRAWAMRNRGIAVLNDVERRNPSAGAVVPLPPLAVPSTQPQIGPGTGVNEQSTTPVAHRRIGQTARRGGPYTMLDRFFSTRLRPLQQPSQSQSQQRQQQQHQHQQGLQDSRNSRRLRKEYRQHHGESILTLLLRLHAKYSQKQRSYQFDEERARTSLTSRGKCRIGDGSHFVTIALDLICASDTKQMLPRIEYLTDLIWPKPSSERLAGNEKGSIQLEMKGPRGEKRFDCDAGGSKDTFAARESDDTELDIKIEPTCGATAAAASARNEPATTASADVDGPDLAPTWGFGLNLSGSSRADLNNIPSQIGAAGGVTATTPAPSSLASLTPEEKRRRARERQNRLMAEFANKQRAFMEFAAATSGPSTSGSATGAATTSRGGAAMASTSPRAHSQSSSRSPQKYSNLTLQSDDKASARGGTSGSGSQFNDEQPINLSSKSNEETQATPASTSGTTDNNGGPLAGGGGGGQLSGIDINRTTESTAHQMTSSPSVAGAEFHDKRSESGGSGREQQQQQQQQLQLQQGRPSDHRPSEEELTGCKQPHMGTDEDCEMSGGQQQQAECCICGVEGSSDLTNPLGQVVLLQSTSVVGHSHLRPRHDRRLPCEESESIALKEETYAKHLERRIDLLCEHFAEASWLDSINIGAEGGVHVQSCGHYLHIECHQSYVRSLDQEDRLRARTESDEFQCPVCRQLANSVLPILDDNFSCNSYAALVGGVNHQSSRRRPPTSGGPGVGCNILLGTGQTPPSSSSSPTPPSGATFGLPSLSPSASPRAQTRDDRDEETLNDQIAQVGLRLRNRQAPNQRELQSSAAFCSHLTKATGPQYRLVRTQASMHSLFLFLASIARTNLEAGIIVQSTRRRAASQQRQSTPTGDSDGGSSSSGADKQSDRQIEEEQQQQRQLAQSIAQSGSREDNAPAACYRRSVAATQDDSDAQKRTCFELLFHVLALNAQTLINDRWFTYDQIWSHLTHCIDETNRLGLRPQCNEVPLLLRDPIAMLLQFLFTVSGNRTARVTCAGVTLHQPREIFTCIVKILFNLTAIQSVALVLSYIGPGASTQSFESSGPSPKYPSATSTSASTNKSQWCQGDSQDGEKIGNEERDSERLPDFTSCKRNKPATSESNQTIRDSNQTVCNLMSVVWTSLSPLLAPDSEQPLMNSVVRSCWPRFAAPSDQSGQNVQVSLPEGRVQFIENRVKLACLPFLRAAAFLQEHLYGRPSPTLNWDLDENCLATQMSAVDKDFTRLVKCLGLARSEEQQTISLGETLNWPGQSGRNLIASWSSELLRFAQGFSIAARTLLVCRPLGWHRPALMQLPHAFDDIFMFYYQRKCSLCNQVPKDVAVCLVCGAPICLRNSCCKDRSRSRQVHSQHCGANTAVFLAVHTSAIVVIRGSRACVWGFVYLDAHDEEDNGLQRGRPLYLVPARFALLETQWLTHTFDHTCGKRWIYLQDNQ